MTQIKCKGCGNMVSSEAESCPKCGFFVRLSMEQQKETKQQMPTLCKKGGRSSRQSLITVIAVFVTLIVCGGIGLVVYNHNVGEQMIVEITSELTEAVQKYDQVYSFSEGLAAVKKGDFWGFVDKNGEEIVPCRYDDVEDFSEGLAVVKKDGKWGYVDKKGNSTFVGR